MAPTQGEVRIGIIGTGVGVRTQIPVFGRTPGARVTAVCSHTQQRADAVAERYGIDHAVTDPAELAALPDVDLVSVATTPDRHRVGVLAAIAAGKHVLCEKPFALDSTEAAEMLTAARAKGVLHFVNHEFRADPALVELRRLVQAGHIGEPTYVLLSDFNSFVPDTEHILSRWWFQEEKGGGWLLAHGSHRVDSLRWLFGEIVSVSACLQTVIGRPELAKGPVDSTVDDSYFLLMGFANGATGVCVDGAATAVPVRPPRLEVYGTEGTLIVDGDTLSGRRRGEADVQPLAVPGPLGGPPEQAMFAAWAERIVESVLTATPIRPDFEDGLRCQEVLDAARLSARTGRTVQLSG